MSGHVERVYYEGIDGRWHEGMLDESGALTITAGHTPIEGAPTFHELPDHLDGDDLCDGCCG